MHSSYAEGHSVYTIHNRVRLIDIEISITMGTSQLNNELEDSIVKPDTGPAIGFSDSDIW